MVIPSVLYKNNLPKIASNTGTHIEFPANLYICLALTPAATTLSICVLFQPINSQYSRSVKRRIRKPLKMPSNV
jgi:hypothetical protein